MNFLINVCECTSSEAATILGIELNDFITASISIISLLLNILFYIIIAPKISFRFQRKDDFLKYSTEFISYLATINSLTCFDGVLTKISTYSITIQLLFKDGKAPDPLHKTLEEIYQSVAKRKSLSEEEKIQEWEIEFRKLTQTLRKDLSKYTGIF